jgi:NAD(P)-dependent dehydrogenase (short-subunit alcohol dehydrogenase family)
LTDKRASNDDMEAPMDIRLDGKAALITGGSGGLGKAMALRFADAGANVAILARRADVLEAARAEIEGAGLGKAFCYSCDLLDAMATADAFAAAERDLDGIDILVNNAGAQRAGPFIDISDEDWQADFELKLFAAIRLCRLALPRMAARRWGRVINVLNFHAKAPRPGGAPTAVTRAAGLALTKVLAGEYAPHNVLVNAIMTGFIRSGQWERLYAREERKETYEEFLDGMVAARRIPLGRIGEAEEFANLACFLASDAASYITGAAINVDGGSSPVV